MRETMRADAYHQHLSRSWLRRRPWSLKLLALLVGSASVLSHGAYAQSLVSQEHLEGRIWYSACSDRVLAWGTTADAMVSFRGDQLYFTLTDFADKHCKEETFSVTAQGRYRLNATAEGTELDYFGKELWVKIDSPEILAMFDRACGPGFFKRGESRSVTPSDCYGAFESKYAKATTMVFTRIALDADGLALASPESPEAGRSPDARANGPWWHFPFKIEP